MAEDSFTLGGHTFHSRFILGSGKYSLELIDAAVRYAEAELVTVAVRRANTKEKENILDYVPKTVTLLPNTSGARTAEEAVRIAHLAKALGCGDFIKIEIMRDSKYLLPDNNETIRATEILAKEGGREYLILVLLYGLQGQIEVKGMKYNGVMSSFAQLKDEEIAAVLNHIATAWGDAKKVKGFKPFTAEEVKKLRAKKLTPQQVLAERKKLGLK